MSKNSYHIVIDARIRRASTGRPVDRLVNYLQKLDTDNRYTILLEPSDSWRPVNPNFTIKKIPYKQFSLNPLQLFAYSWFLYRLKADLVYFTLCGQQPLFYFKKQVTLTHDLTMLRYARAGRLPKWVHALRMLGYRLLFWSGNRLATKIFVPTKFVAQDLAENYKFTKDKILVTYESAEKMHTKDELKPPKGVDVPFIFHVGSPFPHKNIERLVEVFNDLSKQYPDLKLVLPGKREYYFKILEEQVKQSPAAEKIIIPGFITDGELSWLYKNAECYVLPSLSEGFGLPGLEAMINHCPVVSSNATCLPEVYQDAAVYFDPTDSLDVKDKIISVISSKKLQHKLVSAGEIQAKKYSWERMCQQMHQAIDDVLKH